MNNDIVLDVKNVSKKYVIAAGYQPDSIREKIVELIKYPIKLFNGTHKKRYKDYWALKDVTFQVKRGEVLGIVGKNGAGKSTLLKILSRVTEPSSGSITMKGRVSSLLEVGTGFNPELTGRENIYLNGAIIGMGKKEINAKFNDIVEFAGIGEFLDTPVKRYSSGMYVRLGFAVAAHLESDILLVDEVLAVGDSEFQDKCLNKMSLLAQSGRTVIFISHNMQAVSKLCKTAYLIESGKILMHGSTQDVISKYMGSSKLSVGVKLDDRKDREGQANIVIRSIAVSSSENDQYPISGELMKINITVENISQSVINYYPSLSIRTIDQSPLISLDAKINKFRRIIKPMELQKIECNIKNIMLSPGEYDINAALYDLEGNTEDWVVRAIRTKLRRNESLFNKYSKNFPVITNFNWN